MRFILFPAAIALLAAPAAAAPQDKAPSKAEIESAQKTLGVIIGGLQSDKVPANVKSAIFGCLYQNSLSAISEDTTKVLADNKKLDASDPTTRLTVVARVCGVAPEKAGAADTSKGR
ncbi:hypothetical protein KY084_00550 [Stakelama sp. CBK3Z-3]|uniref:Uncharacterized protein n=1 Tax=Stakelama flava TaxID=2860338 RepID=A0ABS6XHR6_9SPHN|nr:hypothetical protein [Stakelama flava]MBW4329368.1 hypothetical protein [Stakelama flava]